MTISQLIKILESIRDQHGNLPVYHVHGGGINEPQVEVNNYDWVLDEDEDVNRPWRVLLK